MRVADDTRFSDDPKLRRGAAQSPSVSAGTGGGPGEPSALSDTETDRAFGSRVRGNRVGSGFELAQRLLAEAGSVQRLLGWTDAEFCRMKGIGRAKAWQLLAAFELARRALCPPVTEAPVLNRAELVAAYLQPFAAGLDVEKFWALLLNRKNRLIKRVRSEFGIPATSTLASPSGGVPGGGDHPGVGVRPGRRP